MSFSIEDLLRETKTCYCLECGKCTSVCPVSRVYEGFSPRSAVEKVLLGFEDELEKDSRLWSCLTCETCSYKCPYGVRYSDFIRDIRIRARQMGEEGRCAHGGILFNLMRLMANSRLPQNRLDWLQEDLKISERGEILYFTGCLPYFKIVFEEIEANSINIAKSAVWLLNKAGIKPVVMNDERCCGHDLLWTGDLENFEKLLKANLDAIKKTGAKKVMFSCPECYRTLKKDYPEYGRINFEVLHISEFVEELIEKGKITFDGELREKVTYHDPCRLGRHMGIFDEPRRIINKIPGTEFIEMKRNGLDSLCCGTSVWTNCESHSKQMQMNLLREAQATGANLLVTSCPKCQIHLKCALHDLSPKRDETRIKIDDLTVLIAKALDMGGKY